MTTPAELRRFSMFLYFFGIFFVSFAFFGLVDCITALFCWVEWRFFLLAKKRKWKTTSNYLRKHIVFTLYVKSYFVIYFIASQCKSFELQSRGPLE